MSREQSRRTLRPVAALVALLLLAIPLRLFAAGDAPPVQTGGGSTDAPATSGGSGISNQSTLSRGTTIMPELPPKMPEAEAQAADRLDGNFAFERMKKLAGEWVGSSPDMGDTPVEVDWHVTAGGSALVETQFPGTDHEMVSMYWVDDGDLVMTHFCATGNQPRLRFEPNDSAWNLYTFDFDGGSNIARNAKHVHSGKIHFVDVNHLRAEWTIQAGSKKAGSNVFQLARKTVMTTGG